MVHKGDGRDDATVTFLPNRLNRQPVIVRGLTTDELWITVGICGGVGLLLGIAFAVMTSTIAMAPTTIMVCIALGVFLGGSVLRRQKRGRPDTWLDRQIAWKVSLHLPALAPYFSPEPLITRSGYWTTRRVIRP